MKKIKTALVGFGASALTFHLPFLRALADLYEVTAVVSRRPDEVKAVLPGAKVYPDVESLCRDPGIDLAVVCLPNDLHRSAAVALLGAGKHVVVEKPMAVDSGECRAMTQAAAQAGRQLAVFHSRRLDGDFQTVAQVLKDGVLGRLVRAELRYDRWSNSLRKKAWKEEDRLGCTLLDDLGSHLLDQSLELFGPPQALACRQGKQRDGSTTVDSFRISLEYPGLWVDLEASMLVKKPLFRWALYGTEGTLVKTSLDPQESQLQRGISPLDPAFGVDREEDFAVLYPREGEAQKIPTMKGRYIDFYAGLARTLGEGLPLEFPADRGLRVVELIEACRKSGGSLVQL